MERPLRLKVSITQETLKKLKETLENLGVFDKTISDSKIKQAEYLGVKQTQGSKKELKEAGKMLAYLNIMEKLQKFEPYLDYGKFSNYFGKLAKSKGIKQLTISKFNSTGLLNLFIEKDEEALPIKKANGEIEPDAELRDTEIVPLTYEGGIEAFFKKEVLPYHKDAWIDYKATKIGYEINFTKYFYKAKELASVESLVKRIVDLQKESDGIMAKILEGLV